MKYKILALFLLAADIVPAQAGSILDAAAPADALRVEFVSPDTTRSNPLAADQPFTVDVIISRSTGDVEIVPTATPEWMTYDPQARQFSGVPVAGEHEIAVRVTDVGTGQSATGVLTFNIETR